MNPSGGDGAEVIYALRNNNVLANLVLQELSKEGQNIRQAYQRRYPTNPSKDYYFIQRETGSTQPITVEYGFLDSTGDDPAQLKRDYEAYANAVVRAIQRYINYEYSGESGKTYTVKSGDSLYSIAKQFGISADDLKKANNLSSNALYVGQTLNIPEATSNGTGSGSQTYTVKSGDSLWSIANRYGTTVNALRNANNLSSDTLRIGQVLTIPSGSTGSSGQTYTVKSGDSLWTIANRYGTTVSALRNANNLSSDTLRIGQILTIPSGSTGSSGQTYTVKSGDSLWTIANRYGTTVNALRTKNNLVSDVLQIGQVLYI